MNDATMPVPPPGEDAAGGGEPIARALTLPCGAVLANRLAKAAMTEGLADAAGRPTEALERLYRKWAGGGAGLLLTGNVMIDRDHLERAGNVVLHGRPDARTMAALKRWSAAGTADGTHLWMQLSHSGRQTSRRVNPHPKAPSPVRLALPGGEFGQPVALTEDEIEALIDRFATAAEVARETGFTGVQLHAAHGYLISEFLSPRVNRRTDRWGGSLDNRARLLRAAVGEVRRRCGADFPISVKLNSADFQKGGFSQDDALTVAGWLAADGVDLLEISGGTYEQPRMMDQGGVEPVSDAPVRASTRAREAYFLDFAAAMRAQVGVPLMVTGGFRTRQAMNAAIAQDGIAMVGLGRPMVVDPDGPAHLLARRTEALEPWEKRLGNPRGWFGVNSPSTMIKAASAFAVMAWYYMTLVEHGDGLEPDRAKGIWGSLVRLRRREARLLKQRSDGRRGTPGSAG